MAGPVVRRRLLTALPFVAFFVVALWTSLPGGLNSLVGTADIPVLSGADDVVAAFGSSDAGSLMKAAMSLLEHHAVTDDQRWVFNFWPPGMVLLDMVLIVVASAIGIPIVLLMVVVNCLVVAGFLGCVFLFIRLIAGVLPAAVFGIGALLYTGIARWSLDRGLFYGDSYGVFSFCLALVSLAMAHRAASVRSRWVWIGLAGVGLAVSAHFRASFEIVADGTLVLAALVLVVAVLARWRGRWAGFTRWSFAGVLPLGVMAAVAQALMLPWRLYGGLRNHPGDFRWSAVSDLASIARWLPESVLRENNVLFAINGHSNWACLGDPEQCQTIFGLEQTTANPYGGANGGYFTGAQFDQMTLHSFLTHPLAFIAERIDALGLGFTSDTGGSVKSIALPESIIMTALLVAIIVVFIRTRAFAQPAYLFYFVATAGQAAPLLLLHMEPRYFLGIELSTIVMGAYALASLRRRRPAPVRGES